MKLAWKRASSAMLITSFTTAAAFATNIVTIIPVIQGFVIFMSILVVLNYILVITVFPLTIMFYKVHAERVEKYIYNSFNKKIQDVCNIGRNSSRARLHRGLSFRGQPSLSTWDGVQLQSLSSTLNTIDSLDDSDEPDSYAVVDDHSHGNATIGIEGVSLLENDSNELIPDNIESMHYQENRSFMSASANEVDDQYSAPIEVKFLIKCTKCLIQSAEHFVVVLFAALSALSLVFAFQLHTAKDIPVVSRDNNIKLT